MPCETQEKPNLESIAQGPPATTQEGGGGLGLPELPVDLPLPVRRRYEKAKQTAIIEAREMLRRDGVENVKTTTRDATKAMIDAQARKAGNSAQLEVLRDGLPLTRSNIRKAGGK